MCKLTIRAICYRSIDRLTIILEKLNFSQLFTCDTSMYINAVMYIYTLFSCRPYIYLHVMCVFQMQGSSGFTLNAGGRVYFAVKPNDDFSDPGMYWQVGLSVCLSICLSLCMILCLYG